MPQEENDNENEQMQEEYICVKPELEDSMVEEESSSVPDPLSLDSKDFALIMESEPQQKRFIDEVRDVKLTLQSKLEEEEEEEHSDLEAEGFQDGQCGEQTAMCNLYQKVFTSRKAMVAHTCRVADVGAEEGASLPKNACAACGEVLATAEMARLHPHSKECPQNRQQLGNGARGGAKPGRFVCDQCPARYGRRDNLLRHQRVHSGVKPFSCSTCGKAFLDTSTLKIHETIHTDNRPYGCGRCKKLFRQAAHLRAHLRTHTGERPFTCAECSATFTYKRMLAIHLRQHTGERPHVCRHPDCGRAYNTARNLLGHVRAVHAGQRPHACPHPGCDRRFSHISNLRAHIRSVHEGLRPFACDRCPASYSSASYLRGHRRTHTGEQPYSCSSCSATFATFGGLRQHRRSHSEERPFVCSDCGNAYKQAGSLSKHWRCHNFRKHRLVHEPMATVRVDRA